MLPRVMKGDDYWRQLKVWVSPIPYQFTIGQHVIVRSSRLNAWDVLEKVYRHPTTAILLVRSKPLIHIYEVNMSELITLPKYKTLAQVLVRWLRKVIDGCHDKCTPCARFCEKFDECLSEIDWWTICCWTWCCECCCKDHEIIIPDPPPTVPVYESYVYIDRDEREESLGKLLQSTVPLSDGSQKWGNVSFPVHTYLKKKFFDPTNLAPQPQYHNHTDEQIETVVAGINRNPGTMFQTPDDIAVGQKFYTDDAKGNQEFLRLEAIVKEMDDRREEGIKRQEDEVKEKVEEIMKKKDIRTCLAGCVCFWIWLTFFLIVFITSMSMIAVWKVDEDISTDTIKRTSALITGNVIGTTGGFILMIGIPLFLCCLCTCDIGDCCCCCYHPFKPFSKAVYAKKKVGKNDYVKYGLFFVNKKDRDPTKFDISKMPSSLPNLDTMSQEQDGIVVTEAGDVLQAGFYFGMRVREVPNVHEAYAMFEVMRQIHKSDIKGIFNYIYFHELADVGTKKVWKNWRRGLKQPEFLFSRLTNTPPSLKLSDPRKDLYDSDHDSEDETDGESIVIEE